MQFLPDVSVTCDVCGGRRYNRETLEICFKGASIADVLDLTVTEALEFLGNVPSVQRRLESMAQVGLGYLRLGQRANTLSGGAAQFRGCIIKWTAGFGSLVIYGGRSEEIGVCFPRIQPDQVHSQLSCQVFAASWVASNKWNVRVAFFV